MTHLHPTMTSPPYDIQWNRHWASIERCVGNISAKSLAELHISQCTVAIMSWFRAESCETSCLVKEFDFGVLIPGIGVRIFGSLELRLESVSEPFNFQNWDWNRYQNNWISRTETRIGNGTIVSPEPSLELVLFKFLVLPPYGFLNYFSSPPSQIA